MKKTNCGGRKGDSPIVKPVAASPTIAVFFLEDRKNGR